MSEVFQLSFKLTLTSIVNVCSASGVYTLECFLFGAILNQGSQLNGSKFKGFPNKQRITLDWKAFRTKMKIFRSDHEKEGRFVRILSKHVKRVTITRDFLYLTKHV